MELNSLTSTLTHFIGAFQSGYGRLQPAMNGLLGALAAIEIVTFGFWWALGGGESPANIVKKVLYLGFWLWFTNAFQSNASVFVHSLVKAGLTAGGNPGAEALLLDPSRIAGMGLQATAPLAESLQGITYHLGDVFVFGFSYIVIMLAFLAMAIQVFLAVLEYYLIVTLVAILIPFGILPQTKFLAEKAIGAVVGAGVKLMVLSLLLAVLGPLLSQVRFSGAEIKLNELWTVLATCLTYAYLVWHMPAGVAGALAGAPSLSAASVAQNASGALMGAAGAAGLAVAATRTAASAASRGAGAAAHGAGLMVGGARDGSSRASDAGGGPLAGGAAGAARALGQAALSSVGAAARKVASPVVDNFRRGSQAAFDRADAAATSPSPAAAAPSPAPPPGSSPPVGDANPPRTSVPTWAAAAKTALGRTSTEKKEATPPA